VKYYFLFFLFSFFFSASICRGQSDSIAVNDDYVPDSLLDYHLSQNSFLYYYGDDDTSRALINMFFRKRDFFGINNSIFGVDNYCGPVILILLTDGIIFVYYGIRAAVNCTIYSRQALLYALIDRQNGYPIPDQFERKLRNRDFH
jgi:hypothetical protein